MTARRRVVITGIGSVSAAGCGGSAFVADALSRRAETIAPIRAFAVDGCPSRLAAEVDGAIDEPWLAGLESRDNLFAHVPLDWAWDD